MKQAPYSLNALSSIVCFLTDAIGALSDLVSDKSLNALSSIVCFLTPFMDGNVIVLNTGLNALSSIVCFLTYTIMDTFKVVVLGLNALSSIVCFLTPGHPPRLARPSGWSQCPLEHCMLSDSKRPRPQRRQDSARLNALSSIVCFLT